MGDIVSFIGGAIDGHQLRLFAPTQSYTANIHGVAHKYWAFKRIDDDGVVSVVYKYMGVEGVDVGKYETLTEFRARGGKL